MAISYYLLNKKSSITTSIMMTVSFKGAVVKTTTGFTCLPENWNDIKYVVSRKDPNHEFINNRIKKLTTKISDYILHLNLNNKVINADELKKAIVCIKDEVYDKSLIRKSDHEKIDNPEVKFNNDFISNLDRFIEHRKNNPNFGSRIILTYNLLKKHLLDYITKKKAVLSFDKMDSDFYASFTSYLSYDLNLQRNTVGNIVKTLKTFLHWSISEEISSSTKFIKAFKVWKDDTDHIALSDEEIKKIEQCKLDDNPKLNKARDIFLILLFTGLRISDYEKLQAAHINLKRGDIRLITTKTKEMVGIPIDKKLEKILLKYPDLKLPHISVQKLNEYIKDVAVKAGITEDVIKVFRTGNETKEIPIPKSELISMHTARRTWNTKAEKSNKNTFAIMKATGHRNIKIHSGYVKFDLDTAINEMRGMWDE